MKRRNSKKTGIIAAVIGLSAVSLVSVGFASWIISAGDTAALESSISVDTVEDHRYVILNKADLLAGNSSHDYDIVFGHPESMNNASAWLKADGSKVEHLSFTFDVIVDNMDGSKGQVSAELAYKNSASQTAYEAAVTNTVVAAKPTPVVGAKTAVAEGTYAGKFKCTVTVTFGWGSHFGGNNPYTFYNAKGVNEYVTGSSGPTWGDDAVTYLGYVATLSSVQFTLTITTSEAA